jgi:hypothetical protein
MLTQLFGNKVVQVDMSPMSNLNNYLTKLIGYFFGNF